MWPFKTEEEKYIEAKDAYDSLIEILMRFHSLSDYQMNREYRLKRRMEKYAKNRNLNMSAKIIPIKGYHDKKRTD